MLYCVRGMCGCRTLSPQSSCGREEARTQERDGRWRTCGVLRCITLHVFDVADHDELHALCR